MPCRLLLTRGFLSTALEVSLIFIGWSFPTQTGVRFQPKEKDRISTILLVAEHSWGYYIYSIPTLYGTPRPFAIHEVTTALTY